MRPKTQMNTPPWYKEAVIYELHVKAFCDGDGDGVGDFKGLASKLDYLKDLGITALWLLPFTASPMRDDGYDTADYREIHPAYGTMADFRRVVREAHKRGIRVITELVLNHTSDQHAWFQRARRARPGTTHRNFYVWSDRPDRFSGTRIIFQDFESSNWTWDPVAGAYYWHRFYAHQPDLNYDNPAVRKEMLKVIDFWLRAGVDGLRLDAVPYLFEREGTSCENLPETHGFLKRLREHVDSRYDDRMLLAEANQWPEDASAYLGDGDECHMAFHFPVMPRLFMALRMEDRFPIIDILEQTPEIPESCQWAMFLRNHDELTLEMVTDEERDFMYRSYARDPQMRINLGIRRRLAPLLDNHRKRIELMLSLLLSLPGTPVLYYGDEIGMGDNVYLGDRDGVRTPMQWNVDRNAGFSSANPQSLYLPVIIDPEYHYQAVNVEAQQENPSSLLWWTKRLIALRKRHRAFGLGSLEFLDPPNNKVLVFTRTYEEERVLVVINLSRYTQYVDLALSVYRGYTPIEMFGRTEFPPVEEAPYFLTLGPHGFYWFELRPEAPSAQEIAPVPGEGDLPVLHAEKAWRDVFQADALPVMASLLPEWLARQRWFGDKSRTVKSVQIRDAVPLPAKRPAAFFLRVEVEFTEGDPRVYAPSLTAAEESEAREVRARSPEAILARVQSGKGKTLGYLLDAMLTPEFPRRILTALKRHQSVEVPGGRLVSRPEPSLRERAEAPADEPPPRPLREEQSNTSVVFGERFVLKVFRRLEPGPHPEQEIGQVLTRSGFSHAPPLAGSLEYRPNRKEPMTVALLQGFVPNEGDAWTHTRDALGDYFETVMARPRDAETLQPARGGTLGLVGREPDQETVGLIGPFLESARLMGRRTAEMHCTLAAATSEPDFAPEPFSGFHRRSLYQSMRNLAGQVLRTLKRALKRLPDELRDTAEVLLERKDTFMEVFRRILEVRDPGLRFRIHGDLHLGQVLFTGKDFILIDFEGEPARPLSERRKKGSPLRDVAGMLRSFHYAAHAALFRQQAVGMTNGMAPEQAENLFEFWNGWVASAFLDAYLEPAREGGFLPDLEELPALLETYVLEKAVYELGYELNHRPDWVSIPMKGIRRLIEPQPGPASGAKPHETQGETSP